ncbi:putative phloem protein [Arabidopsis thaliana]
MLSATQLEITFNSPYFCQWISIHESRFDQVRELLVEVPFKICGVMNTQILSQKTRYSAYIVYKTRDRFHGLKHIGIGFIGHGTPKAKRWERKDLGNDWLRCKKKLKPLKSYSPKIETIILYLSYSFSQLK